MGKAMDLIFLPQFFVVNGWLSVVNKTIIVIRCKTKKSYPYILHLRRVNVWIGLQ
jgi:hypothetical protein